MVLLCLCGVSISVPAWLAPSPIVYCSNALAKVYQRTDVSLHLFSVVFPPSLSRHLGPLYHSVMHTDSSELCLVIGMCMLPCRWQANISVQYIGSSYATAAHITSYITKEDTQGLLQAVGAAQEELPGERM